MHHVEFTLNVTMQNPFEEINTKLGQIESLLYEIHNAQAKNPIEENQSQEFLTRQELSKQYKISLGTIHNLMKTGQLQYSKIGRKTLFRTQDVETFFASHKRNLPP